MRSRKTVFIYLLLLLIPFVGACKKKAPVMEPTGQAAAPTEVQPSEPTEMRDTTSGAEIDNLTKQFQPVFFDFDKYDIRDDMASALQQDARLMKDNRGVTIILEGHCDERGTEEYNLALGERRAKAAKDYLMSLGVDESQLQTISYGENRPFAFQHNEESWRQNRRAQPVAVKQ